MISEFREKAESWTKYFDETLRGCIESGDCTALDVWQKGLSTATEWLRLTTSENVSRDELLAFIGVVHANRYRSSAWHWFALEAYDCISTTGVSLPSPDMFFASDTLGLQYPRTSPERSSLENAELLHNIFSFYSREDPTNNVWKEGLEVAKAWQDLVNREEGREAEVSELVKKAFTGFDKYPSTPQWQDIMVAMSYWCNRIDRSDLVPGAFRLFDQDETGRSS